jgi:hypothetical protein
MAGKLLSFAQGSVYTLLGDFPNKKDFCLPDVYDPKKVTAFGLFSRLNLKVIAADSPADFNPDIRQRSFHFNTFYVLPR